MSREKAEKGMGSQHRGRHARPAPAPKPSAALAALLALLISIAIPRAALANSGTPALSIDSVNLTPGSAVAGTQTTFDATVRYTTGSTQAYTSGIQFQALGAGSAVSGSGCTAFIDNVQFAGTCTQINSATARFCFTTVRTEPLNQPHAFRIHGTWTTPTNPGPMNYSMWFFNSTTPQNCSSFTGPTTATSNTAFKTVPTAPASISATASTDGSGSSAVSWSAANFNFGTANSYVLQRRGGGQDADITVGNTTSYTDTATKAGRSYVYYVYASNEVGDSSITGPSNTVTPIGPPAAPANLTATALAGGKATITWTQPANGQGAVIIGYTVSDGTRTYTTSGSPYTVTGLTPGQTYRYSVTANSSNTASTTGCCTNVITAFDAPAAPGQPTASLDPVHDHGATITWPAPASNGAPITNYRLYITDTTTSTQDSLDTGSAATTYTAGSLVNGHTYIFAVAAINAAGPGPTSPASNPVTPYGTPGAPASVTATPGDQSVRITWTAPANTNGSPITGYTITLTDTTTPANGGQTFTSDASTVSHIFTGLTNGDAYTATVAATSAGGTASTTSATFIPAGPPAAPAAPAATAGLRQATVTWTAPATNGAPITGYTVTARDVDNPAHSGQTCITTATTCTVGGLTAGDRYTFTVVATNQAGESPTSPPSPAVIPYAPPTAPTAPTATAGALSATVTWSTPADNGAPIGSYLVTATDQTDPANGGQTCTTTTTTCAVAGLTAGDSYTFTVQAANPAGSSPASPPSNPVRPYTVPDPPRAITAQPGDRSAVISWMAPPTDGGSPITGYTVTVGGAIGTGGGQQCVTATLSCTITGLVNGGSYLAQVVATNAGGDSSPDTSTPFTPIGRPDPPRHVTATAQSSSSVLLTWQPPTDTGGTPITGYTVTTGSGTSTVCATSGTSCLVDGLAASTSYVFTVVATNAQGDSLGADSNSVTTLPPGPPTCPADYQVNAAGTSCEQVGIGLSMNLNDQTLTLQGAAGNTTTGPDSSLTYTVTTNSTSGYTVTVHADTPVLAAADSRADSIPFDALTTIGVAGTLGVGSGGTLYAQTSSSAPGGDVHRSNFTARIPFVASGTYSGSITFTAAAN